MIIVLKQIFRRKRPSYHRKDFRFVGPDQFSFPSGHATRAWLFYGLARSRILPAKTRITIGAWAAVVSVGRIALGRHYMTDVLCGAFIGCLITAPIAAILYGRLVAG
jgi:membrane-associated phospholipid phosphatase